MIKSQNMDKTQKPSWKPCFFGKKKYNEKNNTRNTFTTVEYLLERKSSTEHLLLQRAERLVISEKCVENNEKFDDFDIKISSFQSMDFDLTPQDQFDKVTEFDDCVSGDFGNFHHE